MPSIVLMNGTSLRFSHAPPAPGGTSDILGRSLGATSLPPGTFRIDTVSGRPQWVPSDGTLRVPDNINNSTTVDGSYPQWSLMVRGNKLILKTGPVGNTAARFYPA